MNKKEVDRSYENTLYDFLSCRYDSKHPILNTHRLENLYNRYEYDFHVPSNIKCSENQWDELQNILGKYLHGYDYEKWKLFTNKYNEIVSGIDKESLESAYYKYQEIKKLYKKYRTHDDDMFLYELRCILED